MKRIAILILTVLILSACTPKAYTEDMDAGKAAMQKGNYSMAIGKFQNALKEQQTAEAKTYLQMAKTLNDSLSLYRNGNFDKAIYTLTKLLNDNDTDKIESNVMKQAKNLLKQIQDTQTLSDTMQNKIIEGKTLLGQNQYDQAIEMFRNVSQMNIPKNIAPIEKMAKEAAKLVDQATALKNNAANENQQASDTVTNKPAETAKTPQQSTGITGAASNTGTAGNTDTGSTSSTGTAGNTGTTNNSPLTSKQAEDLVKAQIDIQPGQNIKVEYDHDGANGDYIIHVYQFIVDDPSTGEGHTETLGWYGVNKQTKKVYNAMQ